MLHRARLQPHETVVVHGATGSVGRAALQVASRVGARVMAVSRRGDEVHGSADEVIDPREENVLGGPAADCRLRERDDPGSEPGRRSDPQRRGVGSTHGKPRHAGSALPADVDG